MSSPILTSDEKQAIANRIHKLVSQLNQAINDASQNMINTALFAEIAPSLITGAQATPVLCVKVYEHVEFTDPIAHKAIDPAPLS